MILSFKIRPKAKERIGQLAKEWDVTLSEAARMLLSEGFRYTGHIAARLQNVRGEIEP